MASCILLILSLCHCNPCDYVGGWTMHFSQPQPRKNGQAMAGDTLWALCLRSAEQHIYAGLWKQQHPSQHTPSATQHIDD